MLICSGCGRSFASMVVPLHCSCGLVSYPEPFTIEEAGRASWLLLHSYPDLHREDWDPETAKQWLVETWEPTIPSYGCSCEAKYQEFKKTLISDAVFGSPEAFYQFGVDLHNLVNQELGKPIFVPPIA